MGSSMPDISMCKSERCPDRAECYRHSESGTKPSEFRQSYMAFDVCLQPGATRCGDFLQRDNGLISDAVLAEHLAK